MGFLAEDTARNMADTSNQSTGREHDHHNSINYTRQRKRAAKRSFESVTLEGHGGLQVEDESQEDGEHQTEEGKQYQDHSAQDQEVVLFVGEGVVVLGKRVSDIVEGELLQSG